MGRPTSPTRETGSQTRSCASMADYGNQTPNQIKNQYDQLNNRRSIPKESALEALHTIIHLHFEKALEKKRSIDLQKKELHNQFQLFFIFLALTFLTQSQSQSQSRLQCRHCWIPIALLTLAHLAFYVSIAHTLRCIKGFKYQRRCHKLTLGLATEKLREMKMSSSDGDMEEEELEIPHQEPPEIYFGKFKRNWALYFGFLVFIYGCMVASSVSLLCF